MHQHREVGVGVVQNGTGPYRHYYTIDTGFTADTRPFLTGVVYSDHNRNGKYDAGEGIGGARVTIAGVGYVTTWFAALARAPAVDVTAVLVAGALVTALLDAAVRGIALAPDAPALLLIGLGTAVIAGRARSWVRPTGVPT